MARNFREQGEVQHARREEICETGRHVKCAIFSAWCSADTSYYLRVISRINLIQFSQAGTSALDSGFIPIGRGRQ